MEDIEVSSQSPTKLSHVEDANLCIHCRHLLDHVHETTDTGRIFPHHQHIFALAGSVRKGCQLCSLFVSHDKDTREKWVNMVLEDGVLESSLHWYYGRVSSFSFNSIGFGDNEGCWSLTFEFHRERLWTFETINQVQDFMDTATTPPSGELPRQHGADKFCSTTAENQGWKEIDDHWWPLYALEKSSQYTWTLGNGVDLIPTMDSSGIKGTHSKFPLPRLQCVKKWFNICVKSHTDCKPAFNNFVPPRLIYLHDDGPRLCLSKDMDFCPPYATLSYTDFHANYSKRTNLTAATLPQFLEKIPPEALCRTFEDAITIAKHIGIRYLLSEY